ncbi:DNA repair protein RecN [Candidatus Zixiibacteriota bacterium]
MLKTLDIKNFAIVETLTVDFGRGLNVLTGETGAGKSILVGAIDLLLGGRAHAEMVRTGESTAICEGIFAVPERDDWAEFAPSAMMEVDVSPNGGEFRIRREIYRKGGSRCFVNDRQVSVAHLSAVGERLGDLCGQHQHQSLLNPRAHVLFLDERAGLNKRAAEFRNLFNEVKADKDRREKLVRQAESRQRAHELAKFQVAEIRAAGLTPTEEDNLKQELKVLKNARRLIEAGERAEATLSEEDGSAVDRMATVRKEIQSLAEVDPRLAPVVELLAQCETQLSETVMALREYRRGVDYDPRRAEEIEARLTEIFGLKQKYGHSCAAILDRLAQLEVEIRSYRDRDGEITDLTRRLEQGKKKLADDAQSLSRLREKAAKMLALEVEATLGEVGMAGARWRVRFDPVGTSALRVPIDGEETPLSENGLSEAEFEIETNPGESFKPLVKIASGGELSRVMLALKAIGAPRHDVSFLVFDEVDSGIGGKVAHAVARQLKKLAERYQVFLISHLPQMASLADAHFKVEKVKTGKRVSTQITSLSAKDRVGEVARMMAAGEITEATRRHAAEIINPKKRIQTKK